MLITSNEPKAIKDLFNDGIETPMHFDFKLYTEQGTVGVERKAVPGDLLASVDDGRLRNELIAMREECNFQVVLFHGMIRYDSNGQVMLTAKRRSRWTRTGIRNLRRTLEWVEGCYVEQVYNDKELVETLEDLQNYLDKGRHLSLKGRPGIQKEWIVTSKVERVVHFYDGIPGIAPVRAKALALAFPFPMDLYKASVEDISSVSGIGKGTSQKIYNFLRGIE
jgi:ERCC4-type nuclease